MKIQHGSPTFLQLFHGTTPESHRNSIFAPFSWWKSHTQIMFPFKKKHEIPWNPIESAWKSPWNPMNSHWIIQNSPLKRGPWVSLAKGDQAAIIFGGHLNGPVLWHHSMTCVKSARLLAIPNMESVAAVAVASWSLVGDMVCQNPWKSPFLFTSK